MRSIVLLVITVLIIGCGSSSTDLKDTNIEHNETENSISSLTQTSNLNQPNNIKINGRVVDGEIKDADVFFDVNQNSIMDIDEPHTKSDAEGYFELNIINSEDNYKIPIISIGGFDIREGKLYAQTLMAFREKDSIDVILTPISTLIAVNVIDNLKENSKSSFNKITTNQIFSLLKQAKKDMANIFALQESILTEDPILLALNSGNLDLLKTNMKINKVVKEIKKGIKKELKNEKKDAIRSFRALKNALKKAKKEAKQGDKALAEAIENLSKVEPNLFDKNIIPSIKESINQTIKSFNKNWKDNEEEIVSTLKDKKKEFNSFNSDKIAPTITINGDNPSIVELKHNYIDLGAVAIDDKDGLIEVKIIKNSVDINKLGEYEIVYSAIDNAGNSVNLSRVVKVVKAVKRDTTAPVITLKGDNPQVVIMGNSYSELGATAVDSVDGNVTVDINGSDLKINKFGEYQIVYSATDNAGNRAEETRVIKVVSPEILLSEFDVVNKKCGHFDSLRMDESYLLSNNDWGKDSVPSEQDWTQCIFTFNDGNSVKGGWFWGWPNGNGGVKGYPEAIYGKKFSNQVNLEGVLPKKVKELQSIDIDLEYRDLNVTGRYNIAIESWLHNTENSSMNDIRYEIMVRFDPDGFHPGNRVLFQKEVEIEGTIYDVYKKQESDNPNRYFYNFVSKEKITEIKFDFKKFLDYLKENDSDTCSDMDELYYNDIEMGVEVVYGSGVLILDKFDVDVKNLTLFSNSSKIIENFMEWSGDYSGDTPLDKEIDINGTGLKWRANLSNLIFRMKNHTLVQKQTKNSNNYIYTIFDNDKSIDLSGEGAITKEGLFNKNFDYKVMLYDGEDWCISENNFTGDYFSVKENNKWYRIDSSDSLVSAFEEDSSLPKLDYSNESTINLNSIKGVGIAYFYVNRDGKGYFKFNKLSIYSNLPKFAIYENDYEQNSVSELLFGLCMTPNRSLSKSEKFINNFKEWVAYLRWPGGSMIEHYDLKDEGSSTTYSVGKWTAYIKEKIPSMNFLIGASSSKGAKDDDDVTTYGKGLVNYLNVDYNSSWGENEALSKPLGLKFVEIGNEPNLEGISAEDYGETLKNYAKGINEADSSVKLLGPCTTHGGLNSMLPKVLKDYGDYIDIVSIHNYTDNPKEYKDDLDVAKRYIEKYMHDNPRRAKKDIKIAFTEYNSLPPATRKGVLYEESWGKIIWHSKTFSYFIKSGLYMSSLWHAYIGGGHATYKRDGTAYPIVSSLKLWKNSIDFTKNPKVLYGVSNDKDILITPIDMKNKMIIFVVNGSSSEDKTIDIKLLNHSGDGKADITTLTHSITGEYYDKKTVASNINIENLQKANPDAKITQDEDDKYYIELPKIDIYEVNSTINITDNQISYTFPKYSVSVIEYNRDK